MATLQCVGDIHTAPDGAVVYAEVDLEAGRAHVSCSHHPALKDTTYGGTVNALLAASCHALGDSDQGHALDRKGA